MASESAFSFFSLLQTKLDSPDIAVAYQFQLILDRSIQSVLLEPLRKYCKSLLETEKVEVDLSSKDKSIQSFQRILGSLEKLFDKNKSRSILFYESFFWYFFFLFLPKVKAEGYSSLLRKAAMGLQRFLSNDVEAFKLFQQTAFEQLESEQFAFESSLQGGKSMEPSLSLRGQLKRLFEKNFLPL